MGIGERRLVDKWQENQWVAGKNVEVKNKDKWQELLILLNGNEYQIYLKKTHAYIKKLQEELERKEKMTNV